MKITCIFGLLGLFYYQGSAVAEKRLVTGERLWQKS